MQNRKRGRPTGRTMTRRVVTMVAPERGAAYDAAARELGVELSEWARRAFDAALARQAKAGNKPDDQNGSRRGGKR